MSKTLRDLVSSCSVAAFLLLLAGCGGSSIDLDEAYSLDATATERGPARDVANLIANMASQLQSRESSPEQVLAETMENLANYDASQFGDKAEAFEKIKSELTALHSMAADKGSRSEIQERASNLKDMANELAGPSS